MTKTQGPPTAVEIACQFKLSDRAAQLLRDGQTPGEFLTLLDRERLYRDGIRFAAYGMARRAGIWWGCLCLWHIYRPQPPAPVQAVLEAVLRWVQQPTEPHRRAAEAASQAAGLDTPAGGLGLAVFYSGGSISAPGLPEVVANPALTSKSVAAALLQAVADAEPDRQAQLHRQFLALAAAVADGRSHWDSTPHVRTS